MVKFVNYLPYFSVPCLAEGERERVLGCTEYDVAVDVPPQPQSPQLSRWLLTSLHSIKLADRLGVRQLSLVHTSAGRVEFSLLPPPLATVVLSGGGAKGVAFPGVIQALQQRGLLAGVDAFYGASVGAMSAAMLAAGMSAEVFSELSNQLEFVKLMHGRLDAAAPLGYTTSSRRPWLKPIPVLGSKLCRLGSNGVPLQETVHQAARHALLQHLDDWLLQSSASSAQRAPIAAMHAELSAGGRVTFGMLRTAHAQIPQVKEFYCPVVRKGEPCQLMILSADTTPELDIARAARASAGLPVVFTPVELETLFNVRGEPGVKFVDGGILLNTPSPSVFAGGGEWGAMAPSDELIVQFEPPPLARNTVSLGEKLVEWMLGAEMWAADHDLQRRLSSPVLARQVLTLPLQVGGKDYRAATAKFDISVDERRALQASAQQATLDHLDRRAQSRITATFDSLQQCLLALDPAELQVLVEHQVEGAEATQVLRRQMDTMVEMLSLLIDQQPETLDLENNALQQALAAMQRLVSESVDHLPQHEADARVERQARLDYLARSLNQPQRYALQRWLSVQPPAMQTEVEQAARAVHERLVVHSLSCRIRLELIQPALLLYGEHAANIQLLQWVAQRVELARTRQALSDALQLVLDHYRHSRRILPLGSSVRWLLDQVVILQRALGCE